MRPTAYRDEADGISWPTSTRTRPTFVSAAYDEAGG
jgi:hypothetical protein